MIRRIRALAARSSSPSPWVRASFAGVLGAATVAAFGALGTTTASATTTCVSTAYTTAGSLTCLVPTGVTSITVVAIGAGGGGGSGTSGGRGAKVTSTIAVTGGGTLTMYVGAAGAGGQAGGGGSSTNINAGAAGQVIAGGGGGGGYPGESGTGTNGGNGGAGGSAAGGNGGDSGGAGGLGGSAGNGGAAGGNYVSGGGGGNGNGGGGGSGDAGGAGGSGAGAGSGGGGAGPDQNGDSGGGGGGGGYGGGGGGGNGDSGTGGGGGAGGSTGPAGTTYAVASSGGTGSITLTWAVDQAPLTLTSTSGTYGSTVGLTSSGGSGTGATTYGVTSTGSAGCSVNGTTLSATSAGTCSVTATKAADPNYNSVSSSATTVTFAMVDLTITASDTTSTYGSAPDVTAGYSGFVNNDSSSNLTTAPSCSSTVTASSPVSGSPYDGANSCGSAVDANYTIAYGTGTATVERADLSVTASNTTSTYGSAPDVAPVYDGFVNSQTGSNLTTAPLCSSTVTATSSVSASPYDGANSCTGADDSNYSITYGTGTATVTNADLTITASNTTSTYGSAPDVTPAYDGFVNSQTATSLTTAPSCSSTVTATSPVSGSPYTGANSCTGAAESNYTISYGTGTATVDRADLTITASNTTSTYGSAPEVVPVYAGFVNSQTATSLTTAPSCSSTVTATSPVSASPYDGANSCTGAAASNYNITYGTGIATVSAAPLTIIASNASMTYGGLVPTITPSYSGLVNNQSAGVLSPAPVCGTIVTATTPVAGSPYATSCSGAIDSNYAITYISGVLTLHAAPLAVTASSGSNLYDHPIPVITPSYVGFVNNQTASLLDPGPVCSTTAVVASLVGSYPTSCTGAVDSNYSFTYVNGALAITPSVVPLLPALVAQGCQVYGQTYFDGLPGSSYAVTSGSLPSGITLNSSSGLLGGTATMAGTSVFTVSATPPGYAVVSHGYLLTVGLCVGPNSGVLPGASYGTPYSNAVTTTGGTPTYRYQLQGGALPPGLTMAANGTISGTPSVRGTFSVTIGATDSANPANEGQHLLTLTVS